MKADAIFEFFYYRDINTSGVHWIVIFLSSKFINVIAAQRLCSVLFKLMPMSPSVTTQYQALNGLILLLKVLKLQISLHCHMLHARIFLLSCMIMQFCLTHFEGSRVWTVGLASCMMAKLHVRDTELSDWS